MTQRMTQIAPWFTRSFPFPIPTQHLPNICARLRGTPARLEEALRGADTHCLTSKPQKRWSAQEQAGHLLDIEPLWLARVEDYLIGKHQLTATDLQNKKTEEADHNAHVLSDILAGFRAARSLLLRRIESLDLAQAAASIEHPRLRVPMRIIDHLYFVAEHDDHHLASIHALLFIL